MQRTNHLKFDAPLKTPSSRMQVQTVIIPTVLSKDTSLIKNAFMFFSYKLFSIAGPTDAFADFSI